MLDLLLLGGLWLAALYTPKLLTKLPGGPGLLPSALVPISFLLWFLSIPYIPSAEDIAADMDGLGYVSQFVTKIAFPFVYGGMIVVALSRNCLPVRNRRLAPTQ